ncbi:MAG: hypothetical protein RL015_3606 [Verrucomicrobiota bacterium]|jgi:hypothetical protein
MNDADLNQMLKRAASALPGAIPESMERSIMERVRSDEVREQRWRSFVHCLVGLAAVSGIVTAGMVCWSLAKRDRTHTTPPTMNLFREGLPK